VPPWYAAPLLTGMLSRRLRMGSFTGAMPGQTRLSESTWRRVKTERSSCPATTWTCSRCQSSRSTFTGAIGTCPRELGVPGVPRASAVPEGGGSWRVLWGRRRSWVLRRVLPGGPPRQLLGDIVLSKGLTRMAPSKEATRTTPPSRCPCGQASACSSRTSKSSTGPGRRVRPAAGCQPLAWCCRASRAGLPRQADAGGDRKQTGGCVLVKGPCRAVG